MNRDEQERLYREAMAARRAGDVCPLCTTHHSALSACPVPTPDEARTARRAREDEAPPLVRETDVETSHEAAAHAADAHLMRMTVLGIHIANPDGLLDTECPALAGHPGHDSYRRRAAEIRARRWTQWKMQSIPNPNGDGMIEVPVKRRTPTIGGTARVSVVTPLGRSVWATREGTGT